MAKKFAYLGNLLYLCTRKHEERLSRVMHRGVAQPGSAPGLGPGGRRFESCRPDYFKNEEWLRQ